MWGWSRFSAGLQVVPLDSNSACTGVSAFSQLIIHLPLSIYVSAHPDKTTLAGDILLIYLNVLKMHCEIFFCIWNEG